MNGRLQDRTNWTRALTVVLIVAVVAVVIGYLVPGSAVEVDRKYLRNSAGPVLFDHGAHGDRADSCAVCHHTLYGAAQAVACTECHDEGMEAADFSHGELKEIHGTDCSRCHEQVAAGDEAVSCRQCHPGTQTSETATVSCSECHDDSFTPDLMDHDEYQEIEDHSCLGCHAPSSLSQSYHASCTGCHLESAPERFAQADGGVLCAACHLP